MIRHAVSTGPSAIRAMWRRVVSGMVLGLACAAAGAQGFGERLQAIMSAADQHLAQVPADAQRYPADLRRIAWMHLEGDERPDALLILKQSRDDCAAASRSRRPCKALILLGNEGGFTVATEFALHEHALVFRKTARGSVDALHHTADNTADPVYRRYILRDGHFEPDGASARLGELMKLNAFVTDDRSLPLVADQAYAASQFDNRRARLSPFRLHVDSINVSQRPAVSDANLPDRLKVLADQLAPDAMRLTEAIGWHQTLELRLWSCDDWMVLRRFWETEAYRLGRIGICADPVVFALQQGLVQGTADYVAMARYRLLQEVGVAFVLRVAPIPWDAREAVKAPGSRESMVFYGTAAGVLLGATLKLQAPEQAPAQHALWKRVSNRWFELIERERIGYLIKSPELRAFDHDLAESERAMLCTLRVLGLNLPSVRAAVCSARMLDNINALRAALRDGTS